MSSAPDLVVIGLRALGFVAVMQAAGGAICLGLFGADLAGSGKLMHKTTLAAACAAGLLVVLHHMLEPARMTASFTGIWDLGLHTVLLKSDAGTARAVRLLGLAVVIWSGLSQHRMRTQLGLIGAVLALTSFVLMGHTAASEQRWILAVLLLTHLLVAGWWFGALTAFWFTAVHESLETNAKIIAQFSAVAGWLVPVILLAGLGLGLGLIPDYAALRSPYAALLLLKLLVFLGLMGLAAGNRFRLVPEITRGEVKALYRLRQIIAAEWLLIVVILIVTAVMTGVFGPE